MTKQDSHLIEMIAGTIGVFTLTAECEYFSYRHMIIGVILTLYVLQGIKHQKTTYEAFLYCVVSSLLILLAIGKVLDWIRDNYLRNVTSREAVFMLVWIILMIITFIIERKIHKKEEVIYEAH